MAFEIIDRPPLRGQSGPAWSPLFKSQLVFFLALGSSSAGSLARYLPGIIASKMLFAGVFFGLSLAGFSYVLLNMRNREGPLSRRERMILAPVVGLIVVMVVAQGFLLFRP